MESIYTFFTKTKSSKLFIHVIISILIIFLIFHLTIWNLFTKQLLNTQEGYYIGDLSRLSYQSESVFIRKLNDIDLVKKHIEIDEWHGEKAEIITIGDSFSNGIAKGKNPYYQDYIANKLNITVLNIAPSPPYPNFMARINSLLNNGFLKKAKTKIIILESIQRKCIDRFAQNINWNYLLSQDNFIKSYKNRKEIPYKEEGIIFINDGNYKFITNSFFYKLSKEPLERSFTYQATLDHDMFSVKASNSLLFYYEDITKSILSTSDNINKLNNNINKLAKRLDKQGIKLFFMPVVDKYNLYYPYILNNNLPKSTFFELLEPLKKNYYFINTKKILKKYINNEIDLYYPDDTHWTNRASEYIIKSIHFNNNIKKEN